MQKGVTHATREPLLSGGGAPRDFDFAAGAVSEAGYYDILPARMRRKPIYVCRLSVTNTPYLGIDLTDENGTARLESARPALPSATYQGDYIRCTATLTETNPPDGHVPCTAGATATNAITVVKVDVQIGGVAEDKEETEGAFVQFVPDTNGVISVEGTNAMKKTTVAFSCTPALPPDELVEVSCSGKGELCEKLLDETLSLVTTNLYSACDISNRTFMLHGHNVSGALRDGSIKIKHVKSGAVDIAKYFILHEIGLGKPWLSKQNHMRALSEFGQIREYDG